jgi:hypothetical protein
MHPSHREAVKTNFFLLPLAFAAFHRRACSGSGYLLTRFAFRNLLPPFPSEQSFVQSFFTHPCFGSAGFQKTPRRPSE